MNTENQLWSIKRIADFLDLSVNYTRNVIVKQANFPEPRFSIIEVNGKKQKSKPRWIDTEISEWAIFHLRVELVFLNHSAHKNRENKQKTRILSSF